MGTSGVDAFNYNWGFDSKNWLFPPPRLIVKAINHLQMSKGICLLVTPEWKSSHYYPYLISAALKPFIKNEISFLRKNVFIMGSDKSSYFGPDFKARVDVWHLDFSDSYT